MVVNSNKGKHMTSPSKNKGNSWEREVAAHLTKLYNEKFLRAPGSGAYIGGTNSKRKDFLHEGQIRSFKGDIIPGQSFPKMNAECKNYGSFPFHQLLQGEVKQLEAWIKQLLDVADPEDFNILIVKITRAAKFICVQPSEHWNISHLPTINYRSKQYGLWVICDYDAFWQNNTEVVKKLCA